MSSDGDRRPPRLWALLSRLLLHGEAADLIRQDLDEAFARDLECGLRPREARRRYVRNLSDSAWSVWKEGLRGSVTRGTLQDARLGVRMLGKQPMLTGVAMLALGLGIPASLTLRHGVDVIFSPLPVPEGDRVLGIRHWDLEARQALPGSVHDYARWRESLTSFQAIGAARTYLLNVHAGDSGAPPVEGAEVTSSTFSLLRGTPLVGRLFTEADGVRGAPDVVILGEDLWRSRFAGDPEILGETVRIGSRPHTVVGVMPSSFRFPDDNDVWLPLRAAPTDYAVGEGPPLWVYGRLADGVTEEEARLEMEVARARAADDDPARFERLRGEVVGMAMLFFGESEFRDDPEFVLIQSVMMLLLLIVCGNVGTLLLARTAQRTAEISIRSALGASRTRIIAQLFIEALVLAVAATGLGLLAAEGIVRWLERTVEPYGIFPFWVDPSLTPRIILTALGLAVLSGAVAGVIPALKATGGRVRENLQHAAAGGASIRFGLGSSALIVGEVILSVGFLAMGGVMVRSAFQDTQGTLGFDPERYVTASVSLPWVDPAEHLELPEEDGLAVRRRQTQLGVLSRLAEEEGVVGVGMALSLPGNEGPRARIVLESENADEDLSRVVSEAEVDVAFFGGLGRRILAGRDFTPADAERASEARPVIVNTSFVQQILGGRNALGRRFRYDVRGQVDPEDVEWFEVVGVVGPFGMNPMNPTRDAGYYVPLPPGQVGSVRYAVEVAGDPGSFVSRFREIVEEVDVEATVLAQPMADLMETEAKVFRLVFILQVVLAGVAFLLSVTGLYALMSFTVSQRTREIGIRTALGARAWSIVSTIARRAALQLGVGLSLGSVWAWLLLGSIANDQMVIPINMPVTIGVTVACAALVGVVACASPTLRGLRIRPTEALREL